jgi:hypothetical protein
VDIVSHRAVRSNTHLRVERIRTCAGNRGRQLDYSFPRGRRIRIGERRCNRSRRRLRRATRTPILPAALPFRPNSAARRSHSGKPRSASHTGRRRFVGSRPGHRCCRRRTRKWAGEASAHTLRSRRWRRCPPANLARIHQAISPTLPCPSCQLLPERRTRPVRSSASSLGRLLAETATTSPVRDLQMDLNRRSA